MTDTTKPDPHGASAPLPWIAELASKAPNSIAVLDLACGSGRHGRAFLQQGSRVTFVDKDVSGVADLSSDTTCTIMKADLESDAWPLDGKCFDVVIVTNYLWRPILPRIVESVAAGGVLLYQTFMLGNEVFGRPRNPDFLLRPGELEHMAADAQLSVLDYFEGEVSEPKPAVIQRLHARRD